MEEGIFAGEVGAGVGGAGGQGVGVLGREKWGSVLAAGPVAEVFAHAVVVAKGVKGEGSAPAGEGCAGSDGTLHERLLRTVPEGVGGVEEGICGGVKEGVGGGDVEALGKGGELVSARGEGDGGVWWWGRGLG